MIFSAQQSIKTYIESVKVDIDIKTAEQRFKHWFLDKNNIKTVVIQRWLKKDVSENAHQLQKLLDDKYHAIIDGTVFDTIKDPNLEYERPTKEELFHTYPFLPNQFPLMIQVTQKLISEQMVEEQYGGKTRSILSMTRDVLNNKSTFSDKKTFLEEKLGYFVIVPQLYDTITYTLKNKDEDQFRLVENTKTLVEDPSIFTEEERNIPISFTDIAKTVLLLKYIDEVSVNDETIIKALFYSIDIPKNVFAKKIRNLISDLKKKGYLTYKKRQIEDKDGNSKDLIEYQIPSQEEIKYIEKTQHVPINIDQIQKWLEEFFKEKEGFGKDLIEFKVQNYLQSLINPSNQSLSLENGIRLKFEWYLDPKLDEILGKISESQNAVSICVLTNRTLKKNIDNLKKLSIQIQTLSKKAIDGKKSLIFIASNFTRNTPDISLNSEFLMKAIQECIRYQETKKDLSMPGNVQLSFDQRIYDLKKEVLEILKEDFTSGLIYYADKQEKVNINTLQNDILNVVKYIYSKINPFAYLGQIKITKNEIEILLKWDPKKQARIPSIFKRNTKNITSCFPIFDENDEFKPNQTEQYGRVITEFKKYLEEFHDIDNVPAEFLKKTFESSPYGWNEQTLLVTIASIILKNEWDPIHAGSIKEPYDKEIIEAFTNPKQNYEKFQELKFKIAESITHDELTKASNILRNLFTEHVSQISRDIIEVSIKKVLNNIQTVYSEIKPEIEKFKFGVSFLSENSSLIIKIDNILRINRTVSLIKSFIDEFEIYDTNPTQKALFDECKQTLFRIKELKITRKIERYHKILNFLSNTYTSWSSTQLSLENIESLNKINEKALNSLNTPQVLSDANWNALWSESKQLWDTYWNSYINLHDKLLYDIQNAINKINEIIISLGSSKKINTKKISKIFQCNNKIKIPKEISDASLFICQNCIKDYNALRVFESSIKSELSAILDQLKAPPTQPPFPSGVSDVIKIVQTKDQQQSWQKYQDLHKKIEVILAEILNLKKIHSNDLDIQKKFEELEKKLNSKFKSFNINHKCSSEPGFWSIEKQTCQNCNINYSDMLDLHSVVNENYNKILLLIKEKQQEFPEKNIEFMFDLQDEQTLIKNFDEHLKIIKTIISSYRKNNPDVHQNIKIKINIEKGD